jgi:hypothetical protein
LAASSTTSAAGPSLRAVLDKLEKRAAVPPEQRVINERTVEQIQGLLQRWEALVARCGTAVEPALFGLLAAENAARQTAARAAAVRRAVIDLWGDGSIVGEPPLVKPPAAATIVVSAIPATAAAVAAAQSSGKKKGEQNSTPPATTQKANDKKKETGTKAPPTPSGKKATPPAPAAKGKAGGKPLPASVGLPPAPAAEPLPAPTECPYPPATLLRARWETTGEEAAARATLEKKFAKSSKDTIKKAQLAVAAASSTGGKQGGASAAPTAVAPTSQRAALKALAAAAGEAKGAKARVEADRIAAEEARAAAAAAASAIASEGATAGEEKDDDAGGDANDTAASAAWTPLPLFAQYGVHALHVPRGDRGALTVAFQHGAQIQALLEPSLGTGPSGSDATSADATRPFRFTVHIALGRLLICTAVPPADDDAGRSHEAPSYFAILIDTLELLIRGGVVVVSGMAAPNTSTGIRDAADAGAATVLRRLLSAGFPGAGGAVAATASRLTVRGVYTAYLSKLQFQFGAAVSSPTSGLLKPIMERGESIETAGTRPFVAILLAHGGYFAAAVYDRRGHALAHKRIARYITRRGQGGRQSTKHGHRQDTAGSQLRAAQEVAWMEEVRETIKLWCDGSRVRVGCPPHSSAAAPSAAPTNATVSDAEGAAAFRRWWLSEGLRAARAQKPALRISSFLPLATAALQSAGAAAAASATTDGTPGQEGADGSLSIAQTGDDDEFNDFDGDADDAPEVGGADAVGGDEETEDEEDDGDDDLENVATQFTATTARQRRTTQDDPVFESVLAQCETIFYHAPGPQNRVLFFGDQRFAGQRSSAYSDTNIEQALLQATEAVDAAVAAAAAGDDHSSCLALGGPSAAARAAVAAALAESPEFQRLLRQHATPSLMLSHPVLRGRVRRLPVTSVGMPSIQETRRLFDVLTHAYVLHRPAT